MDTPDMTKMSSLSEQEQQSFTEEASKLVRFLHERSTDESIPNPCGVTVHATLRFLANFLMLTDNPPAVAEQMGRDLANHVRDAAADKMAHEMGQKASEEIRAETPGPLLNDDNPEFTEAQIHAIGRLVVDALEESDWEAHKWKALRFHITDNRDGTFNAELVQPSESAPMFRH